MMITVEQLQSLLGGHVSSESCQYLLGLREFDAENPVASAASLILSGKTGPYTFDLANIVWNCPGEEIPIEDRLDIAARSRLAVLHLIGYYGSKFTLDTSELQMRLAIRCDESCRGAIATYSPHTTLTPAHRFILTSSLTDVYTIKSIIMHHGSGFTGDQHRQLQKLLQSN